MHVQSGPVRNRRASDLITMAWQVSAPLVAIVLYLIPSHVSLFAKCLIAILAAYLPFYVDGSALDGRRYNASVGSSPVFKWIWTKGLGLPLCECRWNPDDFINKEARFIFGRYDRVISDLLCLGSRTPATCFFSSTSLLFGSLNIHSFTFFIVPRCITIKATPMESGQYTTSGP